MIKLGISEILAKVSEAETIDERVNILRQNDNHVLRHIFRLTYTPGVKWLLPPGKPPLTLNNNPGQQGNLFSEWRRFYLFFPGGNDNLKQSKREAIFIQILESIDPRDADLLCNIKDGIMPYDHIDAELINIAYPGLLPKDALILKPVAPKAPKPISKPKKPVQPKPAKKAEIVETLVVDTNSLTNNELSGTSVNSEKNNTGLTTIDELYNGNDITSDEVKALSTFVEKSKEVVEQVVSKELPDKKPTVNKPKNKKTSSSSKKEIKTN